MQNVARIGKWISIFTGGLVVVHGRLNKQRIRRWEYGWYSLKIIKNPYVIYELVFIQCVYLKGHTQKWFTK